MIPRAGSHSTDEDLHRCHAIRRLRLITVVALLFALPACALRAHSTLVDGTPPPQMAELWTEADAGRDLFGGPGGRDASPDPQGDYQFVARDVTGKSPGYDVRDAQGRLWSVKLGPEAQSEVVVSRLLWAAGYFQPATYYLPSWKLVGTTDPNATTRGPVPARGRGRDESQPLVVEQQSVRRHDAACAACSCSWSW